MMGHHWSVSETPFKAFRLRADGCLLLVVFRSSLQLSTKPRQLASL